MYLGPSFLDLQVIMKGGLDLGVASGPPPPPPRPGRSTTKRQKYTVENTPEPLLTWTCSAENPWYSLEASAPELDNDGCDSSLLFVPDHEGGLTMFVWVCMFRSCRYSRLVGNT